MRNPFFVDLVRHVVASSFIMREEAANPEDEAIFTLRCNGRTLCLTLNGKLDVVWYDASMPTGDLGRDGLPMMRIVSSGVHTVEELRALLGWVEGVRADLRADLLAGVLS